MPRDFLNRAGRPVMRQLLSLYPDSLVVAAIKAGGGPELGMEAITDQFEVLCGALRDEAQLHASGIVGARREVVSLLATRGRVLRLLREHPAIDGLAVPAPVVITGLPHTGADILEQGLVGSGVLDRPDDAPHLMGVHLTSMRFELDWHVPAYAEWYDEADLTAGYGWMRRLLQAQQWHDAQGEDAQPRPARRWVLRSMQHLEQLPALLATFPDAVVVQTHRELGPVIDEMAESVSARRRRSSSEVNPTQIRRYWTWRAERMLDRNAEQRRAHDRARIIDISAEQVSHEPDSVVRELLAQLGVASDN